jgi:iron complex outermembrane receptor protein
VLLWLPFGATMLAAQPVDTIERFSVRTGPLPVSWFQSPAALSFRQFNDPPPSQDALALLQGISGLQADIRANLAQDSRLSIRGFGSRSSFGVRGIRMLLDGIPLTTPDGQTQPGVLVAGDLAQVEVLKGPFAGLYGNAAGGVVHWQSKPVEPGLLAFSQQQSADFRQQSVRSDSAFGTVLFQQFDQQGTRPHNRAERQQALWKQHWQLSDSLQLHTRVDWSRDPRLDDPGALTLAEWHQNPQQTSALASRFDSHKSSRQRQLGFNLQDQHWQLSGYLTSRQITQFLAQTGEALTSSGGVVALSREMLGLQWQQQQQWQQWSWQWSISHQQSRDDRLGFVNQMGQAGPLRRDDSSQSRSQDLALRFSYAANDALTWYGGARLAQLHFATTDHFITTGNPDDSGTKTEQGQAHAVGFRYAINQSWSWHGSTGRGFETPTLTEMAYQRQGSGLNLALQTAKNRQWDSGLKWQQQHFDLGRTEAQLDLFYLTSENELVVDISSGGRTVFKNAPQTRRQGVELALQQQLGLSWQLGYSLTQLDATTPTAGLQLPGVAAQQQQVQLQYQQGNGWYANVTYRQLSRVAADDLNQLFAPAYHLADFDAGWNGNTGTVNWHVYLAGQNLTNQAYISAVVVNQATGRSLEPGTPRQLSAGLHLKFQLL